MSAPAAEQREVHALDARVAVLMPRLEADLGRRTRIPSIALPGFPDAPLRGAHDVGTV